MRTGTTGCLKDADGTVLAGACSSDARLKKDVRPFGPTLESLVQLVPVHYKWRADEFPERQFGTDETYGLVAQDVERVLPHLVHEDDQGYKVVDYGALPLLTLQAVKELEAENDELRRDNAELASRLDRLEALVASLVSGP